MFSFELTLVQTENRLIYIKTSWKYQVDLWANKEEQPIIAGKPATLGIVNVMR